MFCVHNKLHVCRSPDVQLVPVEFDSWTRPVLAQRYMMWLQEMVSSKVCSLPLELEGCWIFAKRMWTWMSHLAIYVQKGCRSKCQPRGDVVTWNHGRSTSFLLVLCGALTRVRWDESSPAAVHLRWCPCASFGAVVRQAVVVYQSSTCVKCNQVQGVVRPARHGTFLFA